MKLQTHLGQRLGLLTAVVLALFLVLTVSQATLGARREQHAAEQLLELSVRLGELQKAKPAEVHDALQDILSRIESGDYRHVHIRITDAQGRLLAQSRPESDLPAVAMALGRWMQALMPTQDEGSFEHRWHVTGWTVSIHSDPQGELGEAGLQLMIAVTLLAGFSLAMLLGMRWLLGRSLSPLQDAITRLQRLEADQTPQAHASAHMVDEVRHMHEAIDHLSSTLGTLEASRQMLSTKLISSQEDERMQIGRELHDEFGQKLTAIHLNTAYLLKTTAHLPEVQAALRDIQQSVRDMDTELRQLLHQLRNASDDTPMNATSFSELLHQLVAQWQQTPGLQTEVALQIDLAGPDPAPIALLTLFRITQEAITNLAKHAQATHAEIRIWREDQLLCWQVSDNGRGLSEPLGSHMLQGNGLAGMQQRVWALGGDWRVDINAPSSHAENQAPRGLCLQARIPVASTP